MEMLFELIRIATGKQQQLSRPLSEKEWDDVLSASKKQLLEGIFLAGMKQLPSEQKPPRPFYLKCVSAATSLHERNAKMNAMCIRLQEALNDKGIASCILKGQGVAPMYASYGPVDLSMMRHSGDIDIYVGEEKYAEACDCLSALDSRDNATAHETYKHSEYLIDGILVELHKQTLVFVSGRSNRYFQQMTKRHLKPERYEKVPIANGTIMVPCAQYNAVYLFAHLWEHFIGGGIGLRQIMDWMMMLHAYRGKLDEEQLYADLTDCGLLKPWRVLACTIVRYLGADRDDIPLYDERYEKKAEIMMNFVMSEGNFGHSAEGRFIKARNVLHKKSHSFIYGTRRSLRMMRIAPEFFHQGMSKMVWDMVKRM